MSAPNTGRGFSSWPGAFRRPGSPGSIPRTTPTRWATWRSRTFRPSWSSAAGRRFSTARSRLPTTSCSACWRSCSGKNSRDAALDGLRRRPRVRGRADRPPDDDVVGAVRERLRYVHGALLVVLIFHRTDAGCDDQQLVLEFGFQLLRFEPGRDYAIAAGLHRAPRAGQHQALDVAGEAEIVQVAAVEAGQHGDGEDFHLALFLRRRLHHGLVAVHGGEADAASAQVGDGAAHGLRHVEELEIDEYLVAALHQPFEQLEVAARHEKLQAELVEARRVTHPLDERARLLRRRHVERHDQPLGARNRRHALRSFCENSLIVNPNSLSGMPIAPAS